MALPDNIEQTAIPSQKLKEVLECNGRPLDPRVTEFGKYIADRMNSELVPSGFVMCSFLAVLDLQRGIDGFKKGAALNNPLVGQPDYVYDLLFLNTPTLARVAFSERFANEVPEEMKLYLHELGLEEDSWILAPVVTVEQAKTDIIDSARKRVLLLDWKHFDPTNRTDEITTLYNAAYPLVLRQAGMNFPLKILREDVFKEALALRLFDPRRKTKLVEGYSLAITKKNIGIEEATLIRDWIVMKVPEVVAGIFKLSAEEVVKYFMENDKSFLQAGLRTRINLANLGIN